jgi:uncharacterized membrane protein
VKRPTAPQVALGLLMATYVAILGTLSLRRHQNLDTNALDLGYTDQAVWNTLHGRPFRFSTYLDAAFRLAIPIQDFKQPDVLLGYHVEPILAAIALLYLIHDGPETLLWLQTIGLALGALPVYLIARHRMEGRGAQGASRIGFQLSRWLPVAFAFIYLLSPPLAAANLSDFHSVALSPVFLLAAFYFLETDRPWGFVLFAFLAAMCKEEIGLLVAMMGLWAAVVRWRWRLGLGTAVAGAGWSLLCVRAIMPHFSGLGASPFVVRYGQFGDSLATMARNLVRQPHLYIDWLRQPKVMAYLRGLWLSGGGLSILHPLSLAMAVPVVAINAFSRYDWMRSGGGHYSASIVPFLVVSAIHGVDWLAGEIGKWLAPFQSASSEPRHSEGNAQSRWSCIGEESRPIREKPIAILKRGRPAVGGRAYTAASSILVGIGLLVALIYHVQNGISPLSRRFALEPVSEHARRAEPFIERLNSLPPEVPISVGSNLYPHVGHRQFVYLFPTVSDAQFILLDTAGPPSPVGSGEQFQIVRELLDYGEFGVAGSDHGFLLLQRGLDQYRLSPTFYQAFLAGDATPQVAVGADFGGLLRLDGFDWTPRPVVRPELSVEITTYWQALSVPDSDYQLVFFFWDRNGRVSLVQPEQQVANWLPTGLWEPGQVIKVTLPPLPVGDLPHAGVAVLRPGVENQDVSGRLAPITSAAGQPPSAAPRPGLSLWQQNTILELARP